MTGSRGASWHDVGSLLEEHAALFSENVRARLPEVVKFSRGLRKEREFSFYGDEDFIPTEEYGRDDADTALARARFVFDTAEQVLADR